MRCPRCEKEILEERERSGVTVDLCPTCRGIWLDRGELEKILAATAQEWERSAPAPAPQPVREPPRDALGRDPRDAPYRDPRDARYRDSHHDDDRDDYIDKHGRRRRRGGFMDVLGDLFD